MVNWIKNFKNAFPKTLITLLVITISLFAVYLTINTGGTIWLLLASLAPILLVAGAAIGLEISGKSLAAHLVLFLTAYLSFGNAFVLAILSFDFSSMTFASQFSLELIVEFIVFVYLLLTIVSHLLNGNVGAKYPKTPIVTSAIIAFSYFFIRSGFSVAVLKIAPPVVALIFGGNIFAIMLLLAGVAEIPFVLLDDIFIGNLLSLPVSYFIFTAFGLYLAYGATMGIIKSLKK